MEVALQDAERNLSSLVESALHGDDVIITREGRPVARLVPLHEPARSDDELVAALLPAARLIWENRADLHGITAAELMEAGRRDRR